MQGSYTPGNNAGSSHGSLPDKIVYYASVFVYYPELKKDFINFSPSLQSFESKYCGLRKSSKKAYIFPKVFQTLTSCDIDSNMFPPGSNAKF